MERITTKQLRGHYEGDNFIVTMIASRPYQPGIEINGIGWIGNVSKSKCPSCNGENGDQRVIYRKRGYIVLLVKSTQFDDGTFRISKVYFPIKRRN